MGMTIDKTIEIINHYLDYPKEEVREALLLSIDSMRKYQKIKEQVDIAIDTENFAISGARLIQIREIINGNVD